MQSPQSGEREIRVGDRVRVRRERWTVSGLEEFDGCRLLTLTGAEAANGGVERRVLTPFDRVEPVERARRLRFVRRQAWRHACRALIACDGSSGILRTAQSARMELMPHQLEPALAVVRGLGSRVLIADAVGLGKTVEAGLVIAELVARGAVARALVLTPSGLREQWIDELARRFDLHFTLLDLPAAQRLQRTLPAGVSPWSTEALVVSSVDYIKRPDVLPAILACRWDIVVVDEAHGAVSDSERHRGVSALCRRAPHVLLLTATPHSGDAQSFASLCGIGRHDDELLVFRRTRADAGLKDERRVHQVLVRPSDAERHMHACVARFAAAVEREHADAAAGLALATLKKRALSSAYSLEQTVRRRLAQLRSGNVAVFWQPPLPLAPIDSAIDDADASPDWAIPVLSDPREERRLLCQIVEAAGRSARKETKLAALQRLLRRVQEPIVVFTEYRDTLIHVRESVAPDAAILHGGLSRDERRAALAQFAHSKILLATDAAGEGLNLHHRSRVIINLELPWNPMRLEQRIGRVDRIGQRRRVHAFHLIAANTDEMAVRSRMLARLSRARAEIGVSDPLGEGTPEALPSTTTPLVRMTAAAATEEARIRMARTVARGNLLPLPGGPYVSFSGGRRVRAALGTRALVLFHASLLTWTGQIVASHLTAVLCRAIRRDVDLAQLDALGAQLEDPGLALWHKESCELHAVFWRRRIAREIAIAATATDMVARGAQPGLFDKRADRAQARSVDDRRHAMDDAHAHIDAARKRERIVFAPPAPFLVLVP